MQESQTGPKALRPSQGGVALIQLADELSRLRQRLESSKEDRQAASLMKEYGLNVMLMLLKKGARLHEHFLFVGTNAHNELAAGTILGFPRALPRRPAGR